MTSREVFLETCRFGSPGRHYSWECVGTWETTLRVWAQQGYTGGESYADFIDYFGMEWNVGFMNFAQETGIDSGFTTTPFWPGFGWEVLQDEGATRVVRTDGGIVQRELAVATDTSMPQFLAFPVSSRQDWEQLKHRLDPFSPGRYPADWASLKSRYGPGREFVLGLPLNGAYGMLRNLMGPENILYAFYDEPELVADMLIHWEWFSKGLISVLSAQLDFDYVLLWEDMCYKAGPLISPEMFRRFISPHYLAVIDHAKSCGIPVAAVDTDGQCDPLIPLFIDAGVGLLFPLEVQSGMDPREVRKKYGKNLALLGGLDKRPLVKGKAAIDAEVQAKLPWLLEQGGFFPSLDHTAPPDIPLANFRYYLEAVRRAAAGFFGGQAALY